MQSRAAARWPPLKIPEALSRAWAHHDGLPLQQKLECQSLLADPAPVQTA